MIPKIIRESPVTTSLADLKVNKISIFRMKLLKLESQMKNQRNKNYNNY